VFQSEQYHQKKHRFDIVANHIIDNELWMLPPPKKEEIKVTLLLELTPRRTDLIHAHLHIVRHQIVHELSDGQFLLALVVSFIYLSFACLALLC